MIPGSKPVPTIDAKIEWIDKLNIFSVCLMSTTFV